MGPWRDFKRKARFYQETLFSGGSGTYVQEGSGNALRRVHGGVPGGSLVCRGI